MRRRIAAGSVFRKSYKDRHGRTRKTRTWFLKYHLNREPVEIASGTSDYDEALALLREKMAAATKKSYSYTEDPDKVTVNQLLDLVVEDYRESKRSTTDDTQKRIDKHLRPLFRQKRATDVGTKLLKDYRRMRDASGDAEATINKELTWLRRGFKLGARHEPKLVESILFPDYRPRQCTRGSRSARKYRHIRNSLPPYARLSFAISYHTVPGRAKSERSGAT
jgi:hypothetical protein